MSDRVRASCAAARLLHMATNGLNGGGGLQRCAGLYYPSGLRFFRNTITVLNLPEVSGRSSFGSTHGQGQPLLKLKLLNGMLTIRLNSEGNQNKNGYKTGHKTNKLVIIMGRI
jgi:hypothetical protein